MSFRRWKLRYQTRWRNLKYHLRTADFACLRVYQQSLNGTSRLPWGGLLKASWQHGASFEDYFRLRFFEKDLNARRQYLTTSLRFEIDQQLNAVAARQILKDKLQCSHYFKSLMGRQVWSWQALLHLVEQPVPRLVVKHRWGQLGQGMLFLNPAQDWEMMRQGIRAVLEKPEDYVYEPYLEQHPRLAALNPESVNTLQILTCLNATEVEIWNCVLRMGLGAGTDHFSKGGLAVPVDADGVIRQPAVKNDPCFAAVWEHPLTQAPLMNLSVPYFAEALALAKTAAQQLPDLRSVSWDVAITAQGPCLLEGNHNWSCQITQIPSNKGLRPLAARVCKMYQTYI